MKVRGRASIETLKHGRQRIVIDELPYQVNKSKLIKTIAEPCKGQEDPGDYRPQGRKRQERAQDSD